MRRKLPILLMFLAEICVSMPRLAVADPIPEYAMKAAFLYNFALFTEWPEEITGNLNLCVLGRDPFGKSLDAFEGKQIKQARLTILHIATTDTTAANAKHCHILYVVDPEDANARKILNSLGEAQVLTVTDGDNLSQSGAMIGMKLENKRLLFEVNYTEAQRSHLTFSSKMLQLAHKVF